MSNDPYNILDDDTEFGEPDVFEDFEELESESGAPSFDVSDDEDYSDDGDDDSETGSPWEEDDDDDPDAIGVEEGAPEFGAPRRRRRVRSKQAFSAKNVGRIQRKAKAGRVKMGRRARRRFNQALMMRRIARNASTSYIAVKGGSIVSNSLAGNRKLRPAEVTTVKQASFNGALSEHAVYSFTAGGTYQYYFDAQNQATLTGVPWLGYILTVEASNFNMVPGGDFTVRTYVSGAGTTDPVMTQTYKIRGKASVWQAVVFNAGNQSGRARVVYTPSLPYNAVAAEPPLDGLTIDGLPSNYSPKVRLLRAGDREFEKVLKFL